MKKSDTKPKETTLEDIHSLAIKRYARSLEAEQEQREECLHDHKFCWVKGAQWSDTEIAARGTRPRLEINKIKIPVAQYLGEQRQNRTDVKIRPHSQGADQDTADVLNGLVRAINSLSGFDAIKDNAAKEQATGGIGAWYVTTQWADDGFDQEIVIKPILSAASSVFYSPSAKQSMKQDSPWFMVTEDISREEFEERYPDKASSGMSGIYAGVSDWVNTDTVRIADYWVKEESKKTMCRMSDGSVYEKNDEFEKIKDELELEGITVIAEKKVDVTKVRMYKISATEVLEGPFEWAGKYIPVVPCFGYSTWVDGKHYYQGMVRDSKDPQTVYNYTSSANLEAVAMAPKDPIFMTPSMMAGHEAVYANYNNRNTPFIPFNPDENTGAVPFKLGAPSVQQAMIAQIQQADMDIQATTGAFSPSLGNQTQDQSGRALLALQHRGSLGTFELEDNMNKAVEHTGTIILDLIPKIYDTERDITVFGVEGEATAVTINKEVFDTQSNKMVMINNLAKGRYILEASTAPSFETQKIESANLLTRLAESNPSLAPMLTDLIVGSLDMPFAQELNQRVRKAMIQQGLITPNKQEQEEMAPMLEAQQQEQAQLKKVDLETAMLNIELLKEQIINLRTATEKRVSDIETDGYQKIEVIADAQEANSRSLKNKVEASKILDDQGITAQVPIDNELETSMMLSDAARQFYTEEVQPQAPVNPNTLPPQPM